MVDDLLLRSRLVEVEEETERAGDAGRVSVCDKRSNNKDIERGIIPSFWLDAAVPIVYVLPEDVCPYIIHFNSCCPSFVISLHKQEL